MKKNFPLTHPAHKPLRVIESIKNDIRKYLKRERRKTLPEGVDFWDFNCRFGESDTAAEEVHVAEIVQKIDAAAENGWASVYVEILATSGHRKPKESKSEEPGDDAQDSA